MEVTEREVKRIVSLHFKNRYKMDVAPKEMQFTYEFHHGEICGVRGLELGGDIIGEDDPNSD